jgi:protein-L-isoaspartate(D-aspartate) O-methyltransferase
MNVIEQAKTNMQNQQLKTCGIYDESVLELLSQVPREHFVPEKYRDMAFADYRIPLRHQQTMLTPLEEATILQALNIQKHHTVLEVGTGSGYFTALLASQAKHVFSLEYHTDLTASAQKKLAQHHISNVTLITGDGIHGYLDKAPYDIIVLTGSVETLDKCFHPQLLQGGKLFAIVGKSPAMEACLLTLNEKGQWSSVKLFETDIPPLVNRFKKDSFQF